MKTSEILKIAQEAIPILVSLAEIFIAWSKSGAIKKATVTNFLKNTIAEIDAHSTGGQKNTWDLISPVASELIDEAAALLPDTLVKDKTSIESLEASAG